MYSRLIFRLFLLLLLGLSSKMIHSQKAANVRMVLSSLDTTAAIACYDIELNNGGAEEWIIANYNIGLVFDAEQACFVKDSILLDDAIYDNASQLTLTKVQNTSIPFEDSLAFLRVGLSTNDTGDTLKTDGSWVPTIRMCFEIKFDNFTDPSTCFSINFVDDLIRSELGSPANQMQEYTSPVDRPDVPINDLIDLVPNATKSLCFVCSEKSTSLCSDGIDNDEDGLLDCNDDDCTPGDIRIATTSITCFRSLGSIDFQRSNDDVEYSIDGGATFQDQASFVDLPSAIYNVIARKKGVVGICDFAQPVILQDPGDCSESGGVACSDGLDNDGDGLVDCEDDNCLPDIEDVMDMNPEICPDLTDGSIEIITSFPDITYSIDSGRTFHSDPLFMNLDTGTYFLAIQDSISMCPIFYSNNPIVLNAGTTCIPPDEACGDGIDNDRDGLIDCDDSDCDNSAACFSVPDIYLANIINTSSPVNNLLRIDTSEPVEVISFKVFDRWGNLVYTRENFNSFDSDYGWDGRFDGGETRSGVFVFHALLRINQTRISRIGDVTVIN